MSENERDLDALARDLRRYRSMAAPAALRSRVRAEIMSAPAVPHSPRSASSLGALRPLLAALLVAAVLAAAGGSAAAGSLPGDPAFPIKRAVEDVQVTLTYDDNARLDVLNGQLDRRLAELEAVAAQRPSALAVAVSEYAAALARVERQLSIVVQQRSTPARDAALARATVAAEDHIARLRTLEGALPPTAQPGIERAIDVQLRLHSAERGPLSPQTPGSSESPARPGTVPGSTPSARPTALPSRTDRSASPTRR